MKKKILFVLCMTLLLLPLGAFAKTGENKNVSTNLKETLELYDIKLKNPDYKETDDQVPIYLFRSSGCQYSQALIEWFNDISVEYGKYFKLVAYDVEGNPDNIELFNKVADFIGKKPEGVPYYVIGDKAFLGYNSTSMKEVEDAIIAEYNRAKRYDVLKKMGLQEEKKVEEEKAPKSIDKFKLNIILIILLIILNAIIVVVSLLIINKKTSKLLKKINLLEKKIKSLINKE